MDEFNPKPFEKDQSPENSSESSTDSFKQEVRSFQPRNRKRTVFFAQEFYGEHEEDQNEEDATMVSSEHSPIKRLSPKQSSVLNEKLFAFCAARSLDQVKDLLERGAALDVEDDEGTALHHACIHGDLELVLLLLAN